MNEGELSGVLGLQGWPAVAEEAIIARDVLLAAHVGSRLHVCHVSTAGSVEILRWAKRKGWNVTAEVTPHHLLLTDELATHLRPAVQGQPAAAHRRRRRRAARGAGRRHDRRRRHRPRPALARGQGLRVGRGGAWACSAWRPRCRSCRRRWSRPACSTGPGSPTGCRPGRRASAGSTATAGRSRSARPPTCVLVDPAAPARDRPVRAGLAAPQHARTPGAAAARRASSRPSCAATADRARRQAERLADVQRMRDAAHGTPRRALTAVLVLEDGRTFRGESYGAAGETFGEAVFSTGMTGYQETLTDPSYHRQVVVMTAPHVGNTGVNDEDPESSRIWVSGYVVRDPARAPSSWRSRRIARRRARRPGRRRHQRRRHPRAHPAPARARRDAGRRQLDGHRRRRRCSTGCVPQPPMAGADLTGEVTTPRAVRRAGDRREAVHRRGARPRHQGDDAAAGWPSAASRRTCCRPTSTVDEVLATGAGRRVPLQRPGRPGHRRPRGRADRASCSAAGAGVRHLLRQPGPRPGARPRHLQAALRPPRHQPAGAGPGDRQGRGHRAQPRLRGRRAARRAPSTRRSAAAEVSHVCLNDDVVEGLRCHDVPAFSVQYHPEAAAGPHDAAYLFDRFSDAAREEDRLMPQAHRHPQRPGHRLRADRHRAGLRVRLLRHPGLPGAARGGPAGRPGQLQPGHDHDRPGVRRRDLHRADHARDRRPRSSRRSGPTRCSPPSAARPR